MLQETLAESGRDTEALRILPRVTHQLVCQAMVVCSPSLLPRLIALSKVTSLCRSVDRQCEAPSAVQVCTNSCCTGMYQIVLYRYVPTSAVQVCTN